MMKQMILMMVVLSCLFITGCRGRHTVRMAVMCNGNPEKQDYLLTERGDLLINGEKCKFRFPSSHKKKLGFPKSKSKP